MSYKLNKNFFIVDGNKYDLEEFCREASMRTFDRDSKVELGSYIRDDRKGKFSYWAYISGPLKVEEVTANFEIYRGKLWVSFETRQMDIGLG